MAEIESKFVRKSIRVRSCNQCLTCIQVLLIKKIALPVDNHRKLYEKTHEGFTYWQIDFHTIQKSGNVTMCYQVFISTNSTEDLSLNDCDLVKFSKDLPLQLLEESLMFENVWHIQSEAVCSCSFRHLSSIELAFGEPEDWCPEEYTHIEATKKFTQILRAMLERGIKLDCINIWQDDTLKLDEIPSMEVDLSTMKDTEFRFFENYHLSSNTLHNKDI